MNDVRKHIDETLKQLKQEADELRVRVHLAKMEAADEWKALEGQLRKLESKAKELGGVTAESGKDIGAAAALLAEEIRSGFKKFAKHL